ncbi:MAG: NAD-dependent succinate-semialdehyde dehydrogenase [Fuscovulum sp.]|nr:NAD-dependent succinate-semialdehyde dehydrogenase [Fuscovulum sp.]
MIAQTLLARLHDRSILRDAGLVAGQWRHQSRSQATFDVTDPATGDIMARLPDMGAAETAEAIAAAQVAHAEWAARTGKDRAALLRRLHDLMVTHADDLATLVTAEMGKPWPEARGEVLYGASYVEWFGEEAKRVYGETIPGHRRDSRLMVIRQPVGVVGAITPWNFPNAMLCRKLAPALAAGCAVVAKPAEQTPLSAIALAALAERAGLPPALFSVITGTDGPAIGQEMCRNPLLRKITFTGSTEVGRILMRQGADQIKKMSMELGGNAPFIVFDDADLDAAVEGALTAKFRNNGQTCVCANRIYVQSGVHDAFAARLASAVAGLRVGNGFDPGVALGPLVDAVALAKVRAHVTDARAKGALVLTGGDGPGGLFFAPTVLTEARPDMILAREETFGPVAALFRFDTVADVVRMANDTEFGLAAYFYARDVARVHQVAEALEYGMVGINTGLISTEVAPFGGIKQSGQGREGGRQGIDDYLETKYLCLGGV